MQITKQEYDMLVNLLRSNKKKEAQQILTQIAQTTDETSENAIDNIIAKENIEFEKLSFKAHFKKLSRKEKLHLLGPVVAVFLCTLVIVFATIVSQSPDKSELEVYTTSKTATVVKKLSRRDTGTEIIFDDIKLRYEGSRAQDIADAVSLGGKKTILHNGSVLYEYTAIGDKGKIIPIVNYEETVAYNRRWMLIIRCVFPALALIFILRALYVWKKSMDE